jgi:ATP-dependent Clp protease adaptor protein ClpS
MPQREQPLPAGISRPRRQADSDAPSRVFIHNDDVTRMDFVVHVLVSVFLLPVINAEQVMYSAHLNGKAYVLTLPADEARRRIGRAQFAARLRQFPLQFSMEAE